MNKRCICILVRLCTLTGVLASRTENNSTTNISPTNVFSTTEHNASCGQVTNVIVQGGGGGVVGPQGERGPPGEPGPAGPTG